jgi:hypothetical protein
MAEDEPATWENTVKTKIAMIKSTLMLTVVAMLVPGLSAAQTVQNFIIDPNPTRWHAGITSLYKDMKSLLKREKTGALEKVVDYFTSPTNLSVVNANNGGVGGIYLYVNEGSLTGLGPGTRSAMATVTNTRPPLSTQEINTLGSSHHVITDSSGLRIPPTRAATRLRYGRPTSFTGIPAAMISRLPTSTGTGNLTWSARRP